MEWLSGRQDCEKYLFFLPIPHLIRPFINSPVDNYRKAFKNNFSLRPPAYALIFWIYMRDGVHKGKMFVSKLNFSRKFDLGAYSYRYPPKFSYLGGGVIKS